MGILDGNLFNMSVKRVYEFAFDSVIRLWIGGIINPVRISAAHVNDPDDLGRQPAQAPAERVHAVIEGGSRMPGKDRFVDLYVPGPVGSERKNLLVESVRKVFSES